MANRDARPIQPDARRKRRLITPEGVPIDLVLASRGARVGALMLDGVFVSVGLIVVAIVLGFTAAGLAKLFPGQHGMALNPPMQALFILWTAVSFLARNGWFLFFELGPRGATPGKRLLGIRIAARDGGQLSADRVIARNLLRDVEMLLPIILAGAFTSAEGGGGSEAGWIAAGAWFVVLTCLPFWNRDRLRAGDIIGGTWVVEAPRHRLAPMLAVPEPTSTLAVAGIDNAYRFSDAELGVYGAYELQMLERVLRDDSAPAMTAVAEAICAKIGWTAPVGSEVRRFLAAYYAQLRARLEAGMLMGQRKADKFSLPGGEG